MITKDHYEILGIPRDATLTQIEEAYKHVKREDAEHNEAVEQAYQTLSNTEVRK